LVAQDSGAWNIPQTQISPRQAIPVLLTLAIDTRPKIRKRAQEALTKVLQNPPPGPAIDHPAAELCAVAAQNNLKNAVDVVNHARRQKGRPDDSHEPAVIHALQLARTVAVASGGWPSKKIESLCELLMSISRSRNDYLVMSAFEVFEVIFEGMQDEVSSSKLPRLLEAIVDLKPAQNDSQLLPPWIAILSRGYGTSATVEPEETFAKLPELFAFRRRSA
jgi:ribosomal RNA-processing protein 12